MNGTNITAKARLGQISTVFAAVAHSTKTADALPYKILSCRLSCSSWVRASCPGRPLHCHTHTHTHRVYSSRTHKSRAPSVFSLFLRVHCLSHLLIVVVFLVTENRKPWRLLFHVFPSFFLPDMRTRILIYFQTNKHVSVVSSRLFCRNAEQLIRTDIDEATRVLEPLHRPALGQLLLVLLLNLRCLTADLSRTRERAVHFPHNSFFVSTPLLRTLHQANTHTHTRTHIHVHVTRRQHFPTSSSLPLTHTKKKTTTTHTESFPPHSRILHTYTHSCSNSLHTQTHIRELIIQSIYTRSIYIYARTSLSFSAFDRNSKLGLGSTAAEMY